MLWYNYIYVTLYSCNYEHTSCHLFEIIILSDKCQIFMNCSKKFMAAKTWLPNREYLRAHRCEVKILLTDVTYLWLVPNTSFALVFCINTHVYNLKSYWHKKENEVCLLNKEYINGHRWERINMATKYIVHIHIAAELQSLVVPYYEAQQWLSLLQS